MIYGERIKYAREKLRMDRMEFATILETTQENIRNIENCKDESRKLGFDKMLKLIEVAELPKGYFFYTKDEFQQIVIDHIGTVYAKGTMLDNELKEILELSKKLD